MYFNSAKNSTLKKASYWFVGHCHTLGLLVYTWSTSLYLAYTWPTGLYLAYWPILGLHLAYWLIIGLHLAYTWPILGLHLAYTWPTLGLLVYTWPTGLHLAYRPTLALLAYIWPTGLYLAYTWPTGLHLVYSTGLWIDFFFGKEPIFYFIVGHFVNLIWHSCMNGQNLTLEVVKVFFFKNKNWHMTKKRPLIRQ
jgi:hypothetical protein